MRKVSIFIAGCFILALAMGVFGQARDLDAIMKEIGPLWTGPGGLGARGARGDAAPPAPDTAKIAADAAKLQALFKEAEGQFTKLKLAEPAGMASKISDAAGNLAKEAKTGKIADLQASKTAIGQCKACHDKYREPDPAGGFKLKQQ
jgi:cytochrome c556